MSEQHNDRVYLARLMRAMEQHIAFLEDALGIEMKPMGIEDEIVLTEFVA